MQLIDKVNGCSKKPVGISLEEFNIFATTLIHHKNLNKTVKEIITFRQTLKKLKNIQQKKAYIDKIQRKKLKMTQQEYNDDTTQKNQFREYGDNIRRYFRLADWISLRGNGYFIDLNPRKKIENESILQMSCKPLSFPNDETYSQYLADPTQPTLPWKDDEKLIKKYTFISDTISEISKNNNIQSSHATLSIQDLSLLSKQELESQIKIITQELQ